MINYDRLENIVFLLWDNETDYNDDSTQKKIGDLFKNKHRVYSMKDLHNVFKEYDKNQEFIFFIHLAHNNENEGYRTFIECKVLQEFPKLKFYCISRIDRGEIYPKGEKLNVYNWEGYREEIDRTYTPQTIFEMKGEKVKKDESTQNLYQNNRVFPQVKYAVITALFEDEFEELKKIFVFPEEKEIHTKTKVFHIGYLKEKPEIEIVAAIPNATGMLDTSIIATQLLEFFKPEYLLMSGVCGGSVDTDFGDIILAKQIFTFQKGKISDIKATNNKGNFVDINLYDIESKPIDYNKLFDQNGNLISVSIEKFEREQDSIISLNSLFEDKLNSKLKPILQNINNNIKEKSFFEDKSINIIIAPMACSSMVINKKGFFEDTIRGIHRKTAAVEMESYGVARACQFANDGKTIPIIFKSVMDKTVNKEDSVDGINYKKFAAYTSAQFMKELFLKNII